LSAYQLASKHIRAGPNTRIVCLGDTVLLRNKCLDDNYEGSADDWFIGYGLVIDSMEDHEGYLIYEVMFGEELGWWDDYELKLVEDKLGEKNGKDGKDI